MDRSLPKNSKALRAEFFALKTPKDVANLLEVDYRQLIFNVYIRPKEDRYKKFEINKRNGDKRLIYSPNNSLKIIQKNLKEILTCVYEPKATVHGFVKGKNIKTNAKMHCRNRYVFNLDLKNFFPSITYQRIRGLFIAIPYELPKDVAILLANICCHEGKLPQGAPTSPIISNMICSRLDTQLRRLAVKHRCVYTRYADDLTFSTRQKNFPERLAEIIQSADKNVVKVGTELEFVIAANGFQINKEKVRLQTYDKRQEVTGLIVNKFPNVNRKYISQIRAMIHAWDKFGLENAEKEFIDRWDKKTRNPFAPPPSFKKIVQGKIEFLGMIRGKDNPVYLSFLGELARLAPELVQNSKENIEIERSYLISIRHILSELFDKSDLRILCFDLDIDYENVERPKKEETAVEIVSYMYKLQKIPSLVQKIKELRPNATF